MERERWPSTHFSGQPRKGGSDPEERILFSLVTDIHRLQKVPISCVKLTRLATRHPEAWAGKQAGPATHLSGAPVVRGIVQRARDGCVMGEGRVLALHRGRVLAAVAPVVIAARVSKTREHRECCESGRGQRIIFTPLKINLIFFPFPFCSSLFFSIFLLLFGSPHLHPVAVRFNSQADILSLLSTPPLPLRARSGNESQPWAKHN